MRVLTVSNCPLARTLGSGYVIGGYIDRLRQRGHRVTALEPADYEWLPALRPAKRLRMLLGYTQAVARATRRERFDVVELWGAESWWSVRRLARRRYRPLVVGRSNGIEPHFWATLAAQGEAGSGRIGRLFDRWQKFEAAFREVDLLTTVSEFDRRFTAGRGYQPPERLLTLENPLDDAWLGRPFRPDRPPVIGYFGNRLKNKGYDLVMAILPALLRAHPGWSGRLHGIEAGGPENLLPPDIRARLEFVPFVSDRAALRNYYDQTSLVLMPSIYESFGLVLAEAMACGCAPVATPTGFAAGLQPGREAAIVNSREPAAWIEAAASLMTQPARRIEIARAAHARAQSLRWDDAVSRLVAFYRDHLPRDGRTPPR